MAKPLFNTGRKIAPFLIVDLKRMVGYLSSGRPLANSDYPRHAAMMIEQLWDEREKLITELQRVRRELNHDPIAHKAPIERINKLLKELRYACA